MEEHVRVHKHVAIKYSRLALMISRTVPIFLDKGRPQRSETVLPKFPIVYCGLIPIVIGVL